MTHNTHAELVRELTSRWPEHRVAPSLSRVAALMELLGSPQRAMPVIQVAGTNGKGSTAIMIETVLRATVRRVRQPHLSDVRERIVIDSEPISEERFDGSGPTSPRTSPWSVEQADSVAVLLRGHHRHGLRGLRRRPRRRGGDGGGARGALGRDLRRRPPRSPSAPSSWTTRTSWAAPSRRSRGRRPASSSPDRRRCSPGKSGCRARVLLERAVEVGAKVKAEGPDFGLIDRQLAVGGQLLRIETAGGPVGDVFLPLYGEHMARNAALAVAAVEAFLGAHPLSRRSSSEGLGSVEAPARLELARTSPPIVIDTAHNPQAARSTVDALAESYDFDPVVGVVAMMQDKDADAVLEIFREDPWTRW